VLELSITTKIQFIMDTRRDLIIFSSIGMEFSQYVEKNMRNMAQEIGVQVRNPIS
jgi:hypothetical protein